MGAVAALAAFLALGVATPAGAQQSILVTPAAPSLEAGATLQLEAMGSDGGEGTQDLTGSVTWSTSSAAIAVVSPSGLVTAVSPGAVTITATLGSVSGSTSVTVTPGAGGMAFGPSALTAGPNEIVAENALPGSPPSEWDVSGAGDASIQGFATDISVNRGETVRFKIKTPSTNYRLDVYRLGYYGGNGARLVATVQPSASLPQSQPSCLSDATTGLVDCGNWAESASWPVPATAVSGIYIAKLVREDPEDGRASHVPFVVRNDSGSSDLLFQTADTAWQAYNAYGGNSLYTGSPAGRAYKVSYNRPFTTRCCAYPAGEDYSYVFAAEYPMVRWLERNGYNVSYTTGIDADRRGAEMLEHNVYMTVGHDEYWSGQQRANVEAARDAGVHMAFFTGNAGFWKTRWESSIDGSGTPYRTLVCYKETHANAKIDPLPGVWTGTWRDPRFGPHDGGRPENALNGPIFTVNGIRNDALQVPEADGKMRFWRNTSIATLAPGATATLPDGLLGYEWDEDLDNGFRPAGLVRMSTTVVPNVGLLQDYGSTYSPGTATHHLTLYRAASGALVFGAGTVQWSWGLDDQHDISGTPADVRVQQATVNLFADMNVQPATLQAGMVAATASTDAAAPTAVITSPGSGASVLAGSTVNVTGTASDVGGRVGGVEISTDGGATWHPATTGRESWSYAWVPAVLGSTTLRVRAADDSANLGAPSAPLSVTVTSEPPLSIAVTPNPAAVTVGGTQQFTATGTYSGEGTQDLTSQVTWGSSTAGVASINAGGLATALAVGSTTITATLGSVSGSASLTVTPPGTLTVATSSLPSGAQGSAYSATLVAAGGSPPYTWSLAAGALPTGLSLSSAGVISGTPTTTGIFTFTVRVSAGAQTATAPLGISITPPMIPPDQGAGGPILVVTSASDPFGRYYNEILRTEGLNSFAAADLSTLSGSLLTGYAVVVLAPHTLSPAQVTTLTDFVQAGGTLIAMRPDASLASLLGLTAAGGTVAEGYLQIDPSAAPGLVTDTIQFHGSADRWTLAGATKVATLYSNATTATSYPAVTRRSVGSNGGEAIAFTYDLARSIVYTRQGNPAWAGNERDGFSPRRSDDLFFGPAAGDPQPSWIDFDKIAIPQADEQQRLLANLLLDSARLPLPRFWYFPSGHKAVVVLTADEHACCGGTQARFDAEIAASPPGCSVDDWQCVRSSSYVYAWDGGLNDAQALAYHQQGFELGVHVSTGCSDYTTSSLAGTFDSELADFAVLFPSLPVQSSNRTHCVPWSDWATQAKVERDRGIRLDTNYYYWPASWVGNRPGLFTGSGMPMRFADLDGTMIDAYQATTHFTDESGQAYPDTVDALLDRALGPLGYYGVFTGNLHNDINNTDAFTWAAQAVASAQVRGVPVISGRQLLTWLDGRNNSSFPNLAWNGTTLTFGILQGAGAKNLQAMLPMATTTGPLTNLRRNGSPIAFATQTIKGVEYAVFEGSSGSYEATYVPDLTPPAVSGVSATPTFSTATITWTTDEVATSVVQYGTNPASLGQSASVAGLTASHSVTLSNLAPETTYSFRVVSADRTGNATTFPLPPAAPLSFTTLIAPPPGPLSITTTALPNAVPGSPYAATLSSTGGTPPLSWAVSTLPPGLSLNAGTGAITGTPTTAGVWNLDAEVADATTSATKALRIAVASPAVSAWANPTPGVFAGSEPSVELGVRFRSDVAGFINGIRFYKHVSNTGTHVGNLWSSSGQRLATATFTNETASGWQTVSFSPPVAIEANTTYVASYFCPNGFYAATQSFFGSQGVDNPPIHLLSTPASGGNGVYVYGPTSAFPTSTWQDSNYWVDVVFSTGTPFGTSACFDAVDQDGDGFDGYPSDPGCESITDNDEHSPALPCDDGIDNDGDTTIDLRTPPGSGIVPDPGCASLTDLDERSPLLVCDDGADNDGDGRVDFPADPGCQRPTSSVESPACQDGLDNDGDAGTDFDGGQSIHGQCTGLPGGCPPGVSDPDGNGIANPDPQCTAPYLARETSVSCGLGTELALLLPAWWAWRGRQRRGQRRAAD